MSNIERRRISDHDAEVLGGVGSSVIKAGIAAAALVAAGPVAAVGVTLAQELAGVVLEGQKERLSEFARRFTSRTSKLPADAQDRVRARLETQEGTRIFETAWNQAAKSVDPEKLDHLTALLKNSLSSEELQEHQTRWLLRLLDEVDVVEIVILQSYMTDHLQNDDFRERHALVFANAQEPRSPHRHVHYMWEGQSQPDDAELPQEALEANEEVSREQRDYQIQRELHSLFQSRIHHLIELGLLGAAHGGRVGDVHNALTPLGAALLKIIDAAQSEEWGTGEQTNAVQAIQRSEVEAEARRQSDTQTARSAQAHSQKDLKDFANGLRQGIEREARRRGRY